MYHNDLPLEAQDVLKNRNDTRARVWAPFYFILEVTFYIRESRF